MKVGRLQPPSLFSYHKEGTMDTEEGESSKKQGSEGTDKPLKKARYAWEVKGKYHLKEKNQNNNENCNETSRTQTEGGSSEACCSSNNKQQSSMDLLMSAADKIMEFELPADALNERVVPQDVPAGEVALGEEAEDYYLLRWQARQLAKGFVDNTINKVLEQWRLSVHASDLFLENCDGDELVEDEGILMAIQSHGLRQELNYNSGNESVPQVESLLGNSVSTAEDSDNRLNCEESDCRDGERKIDDIDFLNAAVSVAISNKGLSSSSYK